MVATKRRSPTSTLVSKNAIEQASSLLEGLEEKPKEIWSLREAIDALKDQITLALDRGYTYVEISKMLSERGVEISASTLKYYLSSVKRNTDGGKTRRRRRTLGKLTGKTLEMATAAVNGAVEKAEGPKKRGGRKPKAEVVEAPPAPTPAKRGRKAGSTAAKAAPAAKPTRTATKATKATKAPGTRGRRKSAG